LASGRLDEGIVAYGDKYVIVTKTLTVRKSKLNKTEQGAASESENFVYDWHEVLTPKYAFIKFISWTNMNKIVTDLASPHAQLQEYVKWMKHKIL
jgi:hypothetical protein